MSFEEIYTLYFNDVFLYACGLTSDREMAQEITQETFVKALKAIDSFDGTKDIRAWLFTIAKNTCIDHYRRQQKNAALPPDEPLSDPAPSIEQRIVDREQAFLIHRFLHDLEEPYKEVFHLRVFGELPFEKIGMIFGKSGGWARVVFHRARTKVIRFMEEKENEKN